MHGLQAPSATALDAAASVLSLAVYAGVAVAAMARAPRDARSRVFLLVTLTSAVPYVLAPLQWWWGTAVYTPTLVVATAVSFAIGSIALFHFTQVFPRRRPWIRAHGRWLGACYLVLPIPIGAIAWIADALLAPADPGQIGALSAGAAIGLLLMLPAIFAVGVVLPFSGAMSLFKSWQEAKVSGDTQARAATFWMLMSQMAGGVLAVLVLPLLHLLGIGSPWAGIMAALTYAFGIMMPLAFAYGFRGIDVDAAG